MLFSSTIFLFAFLPLVLIGHFVAGRRFRNMVLLLFSLGFYAWGEGIYVLVMIYCIVTSWGFGWLLDLRQGNQRRWLLWWGVGLNLLPLFYFKYATFVAESFPWLGLERQLSENIILPIGISFFTFQSLSYLIDVYRQQTPAQRSLLDLGLYVSLFPQLIAGPIIRYHDVQSQIRVRSVSLGLFASGCERFVFGLGKKMLIANPLGEMADYVFSLSAGELSMATAWFGLVCYALQIFFDFSGYSDMAIGLGRMLGFKFLENFNFPYVSRSIREFWRRWHISLSNWFRDYVYIPLGGNRVASWRVASNLLLVFLLCGLWHGASWNFVIWGLLHGVFLTLERGWFGRVMDQCPRIMQHGYVLFFVLVAWVFFRADDLIHSVHYLSSMFDFSGKQGLPPFLSTLMDRYFYLALFLAILLSMPIAEWFSRYLVVGWVQNSSGAVGVFLGCKFIFIFGVLLLSVFEIAAGSYNPFIYFRF